jgi:predicted transcriptional regulator
MLLHEVTGRQLRDARQVLGFSLAGLAARAGINRVCIRIYESFGDDMPNAHTHVLGRLTRALQDEGVEFLPDGSVRLDRALTMKAQVSKEMDRGAAA